MSNENPSEKQDHADCYHCGEDCPDGSREFDGHPFCCNGCLTVYQLLNSSDLQDYYANGPVGQRVGNTSDSDLDFLDVDAVREAFLQFTDGKFARVEFRIPTIHCSSCVYLLERLPKLKQGIVSSQVNFPQKKVSILFKEDELSLKELAALLIRLGFTPELDLAKMEPDSNAATTDRTLLYKLGVAGFCFGNIMMLSFPEYLSELGMDKGMAEFFNWLNLLLALPVLFYSGSDYLISAFKGLRIGKVNMDVPVSLGMLAIFFRSSIDIVTSAGPGFMDSLSGFVFFLLIGKWYQAKTYAALSFERDYRSFFPIAVRKLLPTGETEPTLIKDLKVDDEIQIRNGELVPADTILLSANAKIDYSFVTGEAEPVNVSSNEKVFAGGRQVGSMIRLKVINVASSSYLTSLWGEHSNNDNEVDDLTVLSDKVATYFSIGIVSVATLTGIYWGIVDSDKWLNAVSSVLIIACPCALALSIPFTYGTILRYFGRKGMFVKSIDAIGRMAGISHVAFDKTGTITVKGSGDQKYEGEPLSEAELSAVVNLARQSAHPLSRKLAEAHQDLQEIAVTHFEDIPGKGIKATIGDLHISLGKIDLINAENEAYDNRTKVVVGVNGKRKGQFIFGNNYRKDLGSVVEKLKRNLTVSLISGDNNAEQERLMKVFGSEGSMHFNMKPHQKNDWVKDQQEKGETMMMVGDGLNDSGALKQADFGISIADDIHQFTPASDAILQSDSFRFLPELLLLSKDGRRIVKTAFIISFAYNLIGVVVAAQGYLTPLFAAIFMPLSSVSIVIFTTVASTVLSRLRLRD